MKMVKNEEHNSIELHMDGKPSEECKKILKFYGFWWFAKAKCWVHTMDGDEADKKFIEELVDKRIKKLCGSAKAPDVASMSTEERLTLLAQLQEALK